MESITPQNDNGYNWDYNGVVAEGRGNAYELSCRGDYLVDSVDTNPFE